MEPPSKLQSDPFPHSVDGALILRRVHREPKPPKPLHPTLWTVDLPVHACITMRALSRICVSVCDTLFDRVMRM